MPRTKREIESGQHVAAVDRGRTQDKVAVFDPATAPTHTDAEAAGHPTPAQPSSAATRGQMKNVPRQRDPVDRHLLWLIAATAALVMIGLALTLLTPVRF